MALNHCNYCGVEMYEHTDMDILSCALVLEEYNA